MLDFSASVMWLSVTYVILINLVAFAMFFLDKKYARMEGKRRVPEDTLFTLAAVGGSIGALASMWTFRHKTRHKSFVYGIPAILAGQLILLGLWFYLTMKK